MEWLTQYVDGIRSWLSSFAAWLSAQFTALTLWLSSEWNKLLALLDSNRAMDVFIHQILTFLPEHGAMARAWWTNIYVSWTQLNAFTGPLNYFIDLRGIGIMVGFIIGFEVAMMAVHIYRGTKDMVPFAG